MQDISEALQAALAVLKAYVMLEEDRTCGPDQDIVQRESDLASLDRH